MTDTPSLAKRLRNRLARIFKRYDLPSEQFPDVPDKLTIFVRDHMELYKTTGDRNHLYLEAAGGVVCQYLQKYTFEESPADKFLEAKKINNQGDLWYGYPLRVLLIGETLFLLRLSKSFSEICRRLKTREMRPAYFEMLAAKTFFRNGFEIDVRPETNIKREDFDFAATKGRLIVNVEVTALDEKEFYEKTAINALNQKRTQLPDDKPAVIFCVIPSQWEGMGMNLNEWTAETADKFFKTTRRINYVVFQIERHIDTSSTESAGGFMLVGRPFEHPNPRFPCNLNYIFGGKGPSELGRIRMESVYDDPIAAKRLATEFWVGEFYEWVDSLVPRHGKDDQF